MGACTVLFAVCSTPRAEGLQNGHNHVTPRSDAPSPARGTILRPRNGQHSPSARTAPHQKQKGGGVLRRPSCFSSEAGCHPDQFFGI